MDSWRNCKNPGSDSELSELEDEGEEQDGNVVNIDPEQLEDMILEQKENMLEERFPEGAVDFAYAVEETSPDETAPKLYKTYQK